MAYSLKSLSVVLGSRDSAVTSFEVILGSRDLNLSSLEIHLAGKMPNDTPPVITP